MRPMQVRPEPKLWRDDLKLVQKFYEQVGYQIKIEKRARIVVTQLYGVIIGAVRLVVENEVQVLRGMQVFKNFQDQGFGTDMLQKLIPHFQEPCYCIAPICLTNFYRKVGFQEIPDEMAPVFLGLRAVNYRREKPKENFVILARYGKADD